ncbi:MAG: hypothetical protein H7A52_00405 [Akkermansiaceae bacterium]|nr:hypothetical protein [Akkermansiaceae bacterium]
MSALPAGSNQLTVAGSTSDMRAGRPLSSTPRMALTATGAPAPSPLTASRMRAGFQSLSPAAKGQKKARMKGPNNPIIAREAVHDTMPESQSARRRSIPATRENSSAPPASW